MHGADWADASNANANANAFAVGALFGRAMTEAAYSSFSWDDRIRHENELGQKDVGHATRINARSRTGRAFDGVQPVAAAEKHPTRFLRLRLSFTRLEQR